MLKETEQRILRAMTKTETPWWFIAKEWNISERYLWRIAKKHGVKKKITNWSEFGRRPA